MNGESVMAVPSTSLSHILSIEHNSNNQQYEVSNLRPITMSMSLRINLDLSMMSDNYCLIFLYMFIVILLTCSMRHL